MEQQSRWHISTTPNTRRHQTECKRRASQWQREGQGEIRQGERQEQGHQRSDKGLGGSPRRKAVRDVGL